MLLGHSQAEGGALKQRHCVQLRVDEQAGLLLQHLAQHGEEAIWKRKDSSRENRIELLSILTHSILHDLQINYFN